MFTPHVSYKIEFQFPCVFVLQIQLAFYLFFVLGFLLLFIINFKFFAVGKLPASSVSDEKLKILRKYEQEKIDKILSKYKAFCGNVCGIMRRNRTNMHMDLSGVSSFYFLFFII